MDFLWSPWRSKYIEHFKDDNHTNDECFFCQAINSSATELANNLILSIREHCIIIMNKFPYTSGHLLIAPKRHISDFTELNDDELTEIFQSIRESIGILEKALKPSGFNVGVNIGNVAGAGLPGHIHFHIVPRWAGDKNFMYVTGETNVISFSNEQMFETLIPYFKEK